jgi:CheY-like chemotaxis protein
MHIHHKKVCIIDDDPIYTLITKKMLTLSGQCESVSSFKNGKEAYDHLTAHADDPEALPDLILLDINMPVWDAWDFLDAFKEVKTAKAIQLFVASSSNYLEDINKAKSYELVQDFIMKPISREQMLNVLSL